MSTELITVTIAKWENHNGGKKDHYRRMMLDTRLRDNPKMLAMSLKAQQLYFWLLMESGDQCRSTVTFMPKQVKNWCRFGAQLSRDCRAAVVELVENQLVTMKNSAPLIEEKRKERISEPEKKEIESQPPAEFDFETLRNEYPIQDGGELGIKRLRARDWDQDTYDAFARAVRKYRSECKLKRIDPKFIMHFKNFVGKPGDEPWRNYADKPKATPPKAKPEPINEPPFDPPVDIEAITNPDARKLLSLVTGGVQMSETRRPHG